MRAGGGKYGAIISRGSYGYAGSDKAWTVTNMIKRGDLIAEYPQTGKRGRPSMMITASSCGNYLLQKGR